MALLPFCKNLLAVLAFCWYLAERWACDSRFMWLMWRRPLWAALIMTRLSEGATSWADVHR